MLDPRDPCKAGYKEPLINNVDLAGIFFTLVYIKTVFVRR